MPDGVSVSGIPTMAELTASPGFPSDERIKKGKVAVIECLQEIPCNPCDRACPYGAITVGIPITNLPRIDEDRCTGCGSCIACCPGQAIFVVDAAYSATEAEISFPFEYWSSPKKGNTVDAVNRSGQIVCKGTVTKVREPVSFNNTSVVSVAVPKEFYNEVRSIKLARSTAIASQSPAETDPEYLVCRCEELTRADIERAIEQGATTIDGVKRRTRAGMGLCQGKGCERLVARIISEKTGKPLAELLPATHRVPVRPVQMGVVYQNCDDEA